MTLPSPAVFLDRDDTINVNADLPPQAWDGCTPGDLLKPGFVRLMPGVLDACRTLRRAGFTLVVITNQGGVARGGGTTRDVDDCNTALRALLPTHDEPRAPSLIAACYSAPHHPGGNTSPYDTEHQWRKPGPGMVTAAAHELRLDLARSWMVGDKQRDLDAALAAGVPESNTLRIGPDQPLDDLPAAADHILQGLAPPPYASSVTLSAQGGRPLEDHDIRGAVEAAARAIAERTGVRVLELTTDADSLTVTLATHRLAALGFLSELRRTTNAWATAKLGWELWPAHRPADDDG